MDRRLRKEYHWFALTDYEQEENFLRKKHNAGYKLAKVTMLGTYYFEKCKPEDVIYKLDFNPQKPDDKDSYIQMFEDYGWEYIQDLNDYSYFRKQASGESIQMTGNAAQGSEAEPEGDNDIFSDDESRLDMMKRIFMKKMIPILIIFAALVIPQLLLAVHNGSGSEIGLVILIMWAVLFAIYVALIIRCGLGFRRLGQKYKNKKE